MTTPGIFALKLYTPTSMESPLVCGLPGYVSHLALDRILPLLSIARIKHFILESNSCKLFFLLKLIKYKTYQFHIESDKIHIELFLCSNFCNLGLETLEALNVNHFNTYASSSESYCSDIYFTALIYGRPLKHV